MGETQLEIIIHCIHVYAPWLHTQDF